MDNDLYSIQQARTLLRKARSAWDAYHTFSQEAVDRIVRDMVKAGIEASERLAQQAVDETGFGRFESKVQKNLFATKTLAERMAGMKTCGVINTTHDGKVWEIASPMGVVAALIPSTNPTSTAMYKAIIAAKARCAIVLSPHPRAKECTLEALRVVATAAYRAGAPEGLFACMSEVSVEGTNALLEDPETDLILATGGSAMVKAAYSKGKPAYGVGSGNVPVYVDRSANLQKAADDILFGVSFDWGTLCSTERSIVADQPALPRLKEALRKSGGYFLNDKEADLLRRFVAPSGKLNVDQVGQSPVVIAEKAGFSVPKTTRALIAEVTEVGPQEVLSMETLSPILSLYVEDGWEAGCERCKAILAHGGIGHTLGIHATSERIIEAFALQKPAMRIVVNTVCALGSVGFTTALFPAMTLGPGTVGGSITGDNISPLHLINIKRLAFETAPVNAAKTPVSMSPSDSRTSNGRNGTIWTETRPTKPWMEEIDARLRERAGNATLRRSREANKPLTDPSSPTASDRGTNGPFKQENGIKKPKEVAKTTPEPPPIVEKGLSEAEIDRIASRFRKP